MLAAVALTLAPAAALAQGVDTPAAVSPIIITEVQPGSAASASEEFIELYNAAGQPVDLAANHWRLLRASSTAASWDNPAAAVDLAGVIAPHQTAVVGSSYSSGGQAVTYTPSGITPIAWLPAGLTPTAGHVRLTYQANRVSDDQNACAASTVVSDEVEWSTVKSGQLTAPSLDDGHAPFPLTAASGIAKTQTLQRKTDGAQNYIDTDLDAQDFLLASPSPGAPGYADGADATPSVSPESTAPLVLDECQPPAPAPGSTDGGAVQPPAASPPAIIEANDASDAGSTAAAPTIPPADAGLEWPQLSELLPNPGSPQTDAADEFIELYNPGSQPFDLSGFMLEVGTTTKHRYVFPAGTTMGPQAFKAFFSADTHLSMSNTGGQARLLSPDGAVLQQSEPYASAKDGQAWVLAQGKWQWTATPTPNAVNVVSAPAGSSPKKAAATAAKTGSVKAASTTKKSAASKKTAALQNSQNVASVAGDTPVHLAVLAAVAVFALLYGAYEYRHDLANRVHQLRSYRAARAAARASPKGR